MVSQLCAEATRPAWTPAGALSWRKVSRARLLSIIQHHTGSSQRRQVHLGRLCGAVLRGGGLKMSPPSTRVGFCGGGGGLPRSNSLRPTRRCKVLPGVGAIAFPFSQVVVLSWWCVCVPRSDSLIVIRHGGEVLAGVGDSSHIFLLSDLALFRAVGRQLSRQALLSAVGWSHDSALYPCAQCRAFGPHAEA